MKNLQKIILALLVVWTFIFSLTSTSFASDEWVVLTKDNVLKICVLKGLELNCHQIWGEWGVSIEKWTFEWLDNLISLDLWRNKIKNIEEWMFKWLENLEILNLMNNEIINIEEWAFKWLDNLELLNLWRNRYTITNIEKWAFEWLKKLSKLWLQKNKIKNIQERTFEWLDNLEKLDLSENFEITLKKWSFKWLSNLQELNLKDNRIKILEEWTFEWLDSLQKLNLMWNDEIILEEWTFKWLDSLQKLNLDTSLQNKDYLDFSCMNLSDFTCPRGFRRIIDDKIYTRKWVTEETAKNKLIIECWDTNENITNEEYVLTSKDNTLVFIITKRLEAKFEENGEIYKKTILNVLSLLWNKYKTTKPRISAILLSTIENIKK